MSVSLAGCPSPCLSASQSISDLSVKTISTVLSTIVIVVVVIVVAHVDAFLPGDCPNQARGDHRHSNKHSPVHWLVIGSDITALSDTHVHIQW